MLHEGTAEVIAPEAPTLPADTSASESADLTPAEQAVVSKDQNAYRAARHEERFGKPKESAEKPAAEKSKPAVEAVADGETGKPAETPERRLSNNQRKANDAIQRAVETATAELQRENARLKALTEPRPEPPRAADDPEPDPANEKKYPNGQYDSGFFKDIAAWQARQIIRADRAQQAAENRQRSEVSTFQEQAEKSRAALTDALKAEGVDIAVPEQATAWIKKSKIDAQLFTLSPSIALKPGEPSTFGHVIADWVASTPYPLQIIKHLSDRAEVHRLANLSPAAFLREQGRIEAGFAKPDKKTAPAPQKQITEAADPAHTLGSRPVEAPDAIDGALRENNFTAYQHAKRSKGVLHYAG